MPGMDNYLARIHAGPVSPMTGGTDVAICLVGYLTICSRLGHGIACPARRERSSCVVQYYPEFLMRPISLTSLLIMLMTIVACDSATDPVEPPGPAQPEAQTETIVAQRLFWFEPADLSACGKPTKVVVNWDTTSLEDVGAVEVIAIGAKGMERAFLVGGRIGSRETGEWMQAGSQMILRNKADGVELARARVGSIPCA